jgi:hypothetical protein
MAELGLVEVETAEAGTMRVGIEEFYHERRDGGGLNSEL